MSSQPAVARQEDQAGELHRGALSLTGAVMQGVTHIAPTAGVILILQAEVAAVGLAAPSSVISLEELVDELFHVHAHSSTL